MRTTVHATVVVLALTTAAGSALAQGRQAELAIPFKATTVATETGLNLDLRYLNPENPGARPPTIRKLAIHLPPGTRIDTTAVPRCEATNEEIQARGRDACPPESLVGTGKLDVHVGGPEDPQTTDIALFNGPGQILEMVLFEGTNALAALERLRVEGSTIAGEPVQVPPGAPPDQRFSVSRIVWDIPARGRYLVTPASCDGTWTAVGEFEFADGSSARAQSSQACRAAATTQPEPPAARSVRVAVAPGRVVRDRRTRLRVRVLSDDPVCVRGAVVRLGRRAARTDDAGRVTLVARVRWGRPVVNVRVATPSCGRARAVLQVRGR